MKHFAWTAALAFVDAPFAAAKRASGQQIMSTISGNSVRGSMADGSAYTEFYDADGTNEGENYTGA